MEESHPNPITYITDWLKKGLKKAFMPENFPASFFSPSPQFYWMDQQEVLSLCTDFDLFK